MQEPPESVTRKQEKGYVNQEPKRSIDAVFDFVDKVGKTLIK
jgi:hypothetical protein